VPTAAIRHALRALASETGLMAGPRRSPKPALVCHWYLIGDEGRLECRWQAEANVATPIEDLAQAVCIENLIRVDDVTEGPAREIPARPAFVMPCVAWLRHTFRWKRKT
jgi:hypothetical protein